jgi:DNA-binding CsgD family transcriptional regulator
MEKTIEIDGWRGRLDAGLPRRQLEALLFACADLTVKQIARRMGIGHQSVQQRLDDARFKLGMQRSVRGLCLEALRRGIVGPLVILLCSLCAFQTFLDLGHMQRAQRVTRIQQTRGGRRDTFDNPFDFC